jgi:hypothetical protein
VASALGGIFLIFFCRSSTLTLCLSFKEKGL